MKQYLYCKFEGEKITELGGKWNTLKKKWFFQTMTDELKSNEEVSIDVQYELKEH